MPKKRIVLRVFLAALLFFAANSYLLVAESIKTLWAVIPAYLLVNAVPGFTDPKVKLARIKWLIHGGESLQVFVLSVVLSAALHIGLLFFMPDNIKPLLWSMLYCYCAHFIIFWNGIISTYIASCALGIRYRVIGAICGPIPIAHLLALRSILKIVSNEIRMETEKEYMNYGRRKDKICKTKYPILFVHGVFFRDTKYFNYWGRIPAELKRNGSEIYYGNHQSALCIKHSAEELSLRIKEIVEKSGCGKVNIIAHSKGGLDARYALANLDCAPMVASLTTVNTPHRGCKFADHLLTKIAQPIQKGIAATYNEAARHLGDTDPDFLAAVEDLRASSCKEMFSQMPLPEGIVCQSIGSVLKNAKGGKFPLNFSYTLVKEHDGENDGLVSVDSFGFGESFRLLYPKGEQGISHGDMIDLSREDVEGFDVREFYVELVSNLRERGL